MCGISGIYGFEDDQVFRMIEFTDILLFRTIDNYSSFKFLGWEALVDKVKIITADPNYSSIFKNAKSIEIIQTKIEERVKNVHTI